MSISHGNEPSINFTAIKDWADSYQYSSDGNSNNSGSNGNPDSGRQHDPIGYNPPSCNIHQCGYNSGPLRIPGFGTFIPSGTILNPDMRTGNMAHKYIQLYLLSHYNMMFECYTKGKKYRIDAVSFLSTQFVELYQIKPSGWNGDEDSNSDMNKWVDTVNSNGFANPIYEEIRKHQDGAVAGTQYLRAPLKTHPVLCNKEFTHNRLAFYNTTQV